MLLAAGTRDVTGLPVYVYEDDGESKAFPCAEVALSQKTAEALIENGFIPMAAIRDQDVVRAACLQSVAGTQLVGRTIQ
jgi:predicted component of type VI protein secretion system